MTLILPRRSFLLGLASALAAPSIVRSSSIMPVKSVGISWLEETAMFPLVSRRAWMLTNAEWTSGARENNVPRGKLKFQEVWLPDTGAPPALKRISTRETESCHFEYRHEPLFGMDGSVQMIHRPGTAELVVSAREATELTLDPLSTLYEIG